MPPARVAVAPRTIVLFVAASLGSVVLLAAVYALRTIVIQLILAIVLAMAAEPLVRLFERRGMPRARAVGISFAVVAIVLSAFGYLLVRPLVDESTRFVHDAPALMHHLSQHPNGGHDGIRTYEHPGTAAADSAAERP